MKQVFGHNYNKRVMRQQQLAAFDYEAPVVLDRVFSVALGAALVLCLAGIGVQGFQAVSR